MTMAALCFGLFILGCGKKDDNKPAPNPNVQDAQEHLNNIGYKTEAIKGNKTEENRYALFSYPKDNQLNLAGKHVSFQISPYTAQREFALVVRLHEANG